MYRKDKIYKIKNCEYKSMYFALSARLIGAGFNYFITFVTVIFNTLIHIANKSNRLVCLRFLSIQQYLTMYIPAVLSTVCSQMLQKLIIHFIHLKNLRNMKKNLNLSCCMRMCRIAA
jgi:uncharacterized membrane protein